MRCKSTVIIQIDQTFYCFFSKKVHFSTLLHIFQKKIAFRLVVIFLFSIFAPQLSNGAIAQLVEQRTENPCVPGSIPGGTTLKKSKRHQVKSGFFVFPRHAKNGKILPFEVEQKVEIKGGAKISTELESFSLICNVLRIKKTWSVSYFCPNYTAYDTRKQSIKTFCLTSLHLYFLYKTYSYQDILCILRSEGMTRHSIRHPPRLLLFYPTSKR